MKIRIYQINSERDNLTVTRMFLSLEQLEKHFKSTEIRSEFYDKVFDGAVDCQSLDDVYRKFNLDHPNDYRGRSMSVSDVVEVVEAPKGIDKGYYFVDDFGFKSISFHPEKTLDMSSSELLTVLYIKPHESPEIWYIRPELEDMQRLVGGYIERIMPFDDEVAIIANEDGKINRLEYNRAIYDESDGKRGALIDVIAGDFFLVHSPYESEHFQSLTPEMIRKYQKRFQYPRTFLLSTALLSLSLKLPIEAAGTDELYEFLFSE